MGAIAPTDRPSASSADAIGWVRSSVAAAWRRSIGPPTCGSVERSRSSSCDRRSRATRTWPSASDGKPSRRRSCVIGTSWPAWTRAPRAISRTSSWTSSTARTWPRACVEVAASPRGRRPGSASTSPAGWRSPTSAGIVHRDVKPGNILLAADGRALVTDFGIARLAADAEAVLPGTTLGSVHYFSPEQARGIATTPASDVYGLGLVLFEMLTGQRAWSGDTTDAIALARIGSPAPSPRALRPEIPLALDAVVQRALAPDAADRYPNGNALADALQPIVQAGDASSPTAVVRVPPQPPDLVPGDGPLPPSRPRANRGTVRGRPRVPRPAGTSRPRRPPAPPFGARRRGAGCRGRRRRHPAGRGPPRGRSRRRVGRVAESGGCRQPDA